MKKVLKLAAIGLIAAALAVGVMGCTANGNGSTGPGSPQGAPATASYIPGPSQQTGVWVNGEGRVTAVPDLALLQLGVESQEATVAAAQTKARDAMNKVMGVLTSNGIADKDIKTVQFQIQPVTTYDQKNSRTQIIGYRVSNTVNAKIRKLDQLGPVIDAVAAAGGDLTRIQSISFTIENTTALLNQAREAAMNDAQAKADQLAKLGKISLGKPVYISENSSTPVPPIPVRMAAGVAAAEAAPTPINPGEQEVRVNVQVVYAIQ